MAGCRRMAPALGQRQRLPALALALALTLLLVAPPLASASTVLDVYRSLQFDLAGVPLGSRRGMLSQHATLPASPDLHRAVVVVRVVGMDFDRVKELLTSRTHTAAGFLFVLPRDFEDGARPPPPNALALESLLLETHIPVPVWFTVDRPAIEEMVASIKAELAAGRPPAATTARYQLNVGGKEPAKMPAGGLLKNLRGDLRGKAPAAEGDPLGPVVIIAAAYDAFGGVPGLSMGADATASGAAALLEVARLLGKVYAEPEKRAGVTFVFLLASGSALDQAGLHAWLNAQDQAFLERVSFALCLHALGGGPTLDDAGAAAGPGGAAKVPLFLHSSKPRADPAVAGLLDAFESTASGFGLPLTYVHKKVNVSAPAVAWPHEAFALKRVPAVTLTSRPAPAGRLRDGSMWDVHGRVNPAVVESAVRLIIEAVAKATGVAPTPGAPVLKAGKGGLDVNAAGLTSWLRQLGRVPRPAPFLSSIPPAAPLPDALLKALKEATGHMSASTFTLDGTRWAFYDLVAADMSVSYVASLMFDVYLTLGGLLYLGALFCGLKIATRGWPEFVRWAKEVAHPTVKGGKGGRGDKGRGAAAGGSGAGKKAKGGKAS